MRLTQWTHAHVRNSSSVKTQLDNALINIVSAVKYDDHSVFDRQHLGFAAVVTVYLVIIAPSQSGT